MARISGEGHDLGHCIVAAVKWGREMLDGVSLTDEDLLSSGSAVGDHNFKGLNRVDFT